MNEQTEITIANLLEEISALRQVLADQDRLSRANENSKMLWALKDIAEFTGFTVRHVQTWISDVHFPSAVEMPSQRDHRKPTNKPRWVAGEVIRYINRFKRKH